MSFLPLPSPRRTVFALAIFSFLPLLVACPKKETPAVVDAAPPPPAPVEEASVTNLVPLEEDAGDAGDAAPDVKKATGPYVPPNVARLKQCCAQLAAEGKRLGSSPEGNMFVTASQQCSVLAAQVGPSGNAPELGTLRALLTGRTIPPICAGF